MTAGQETVSKRPALRVLVVGGTSRAALAFRRHAAIVADVKVSTLVRRATEPFADEVMTRVSDYFSPPEQILQNADVVINFAGLTRERDPQALQNVNVDGPIRLSVAAKRLGVSHFVQLSSFHVYGYAEDVSPATPVMPQTPYARSKLAADNALLKLASPSFAVTALRLPILYGKGVGENLTKLAALMSKVPVFPVSAANPHRSGMHIDNLAILLETVLRNHAGGIRFGADPEPFSLELLADVIADATGRRPRLMRLPEQAFWPLRSVANGLYSRLYKRNLVQQRDCVAPRDEFPMTVRAGLRDILPC